MSVEPRRPFARRGLTRVGLLTCIVCVLVVASLLPPLILRSREVARSNACQENLRRLGVALHQHSELPDSDDQLSDGAVDYVRNGCPDEYSWIASVVERVGDREAPFVCPASPVVGLETLNDLVAAKDSSAALGIDAERLEAGRCNPRDGLLSTEAGSAARRTKVTELLDAGYDTTYSPSWLFSHGQPRLVNVNLGDQHVSRVVPPLDLLANTTGPLTLRQVETAEIPANNVPALADGAATRTLDSTVGEGREKGMPLAPSASRGPSFRHADEILLVGENGNTDVNVLIPTAFPPVGTRMTTAEERKYASTRGSLAPEYGRKFVASDTRGWGATHGNQANVLMVDGSVKTLEDLDGDGLFNPGLPRTFEGPATRGDFATNLVEVSAFEVYTGTLLIVTRMQKGVFTSTRVWDWQDFVEAHETSGEE